MACVTVVTGQGAMGTINRSSKVQRSGGHLHPYGMSMAILRRSTAVTATSTEDKVTEGVKKLDMFTTAEEKLPLRSIDGLDSNYCDDFECTSSPAVESTVRAFSRDLTRQRYTQSLFNRDATYNDGFRKFKGSDNYKRQFWFQVGIQKPSVNIVKMRMADKSTAEIQWRISGNAAMGAVDIGVTSVIELNLLTGRIISHKESWDLSRLNPVAAASTTFSRWSWSMKQAGDDARANIAESLSSMDNDQESGSITPNPNDPTKFFFGNQQDSQWNDYVSYATLAALLYLCFRAFGELDKL